MELFVAGCSNSWTERATSCYMIDKHILFDCGEGTVKNITKCCGEKVVKGVDYIFITHFHTDHLFGITPYIAQLLSTYPKTGKKLTIIGPKGIKKLIYKFIPMHIYRGKQPLKTYMNILEIKNFKEKFFVDKLEITCQKLEHGDFSNVGYIIKTKDGILGYTGDASYNQNIINFASKCDSLICDVSSMENTYAHIGVEGHNELKKIFPNLNLFSVHSREEVFQNAKKLGLNPLFEQTFYEFKNKNLIKKTLK